MSGPTLDVARSFLFVPGSRPDRFDKAAACGADVVVLDLEDAVPADDKHAARAGVVAWLTGERRPRGVLAAVRVNAADTPWHEADIAALLGTDASVMLAKAEAGPGLRALGRSGRPVVALIETAVGVLDAREIAATPGVVRLAFGSFDLAAELGIDPVDAEALQAARSALVLTSAAAGLPGPIDGVRAAVEDQEGLATETERARRLGFTGKLCIHPRQIDTVDRLLGPTEIEISWASGILAAVPADGVSLIDGQMVDKPVIDRARRIAAAAAAKESHP